MKKIMFILLATFCTSVLAGRNHVSLVVSVQNNTATTCYLTRLNLIQGSFIAVPADFKFKISSGETMILPSMAESLLYGPKADLFYECEDGRSITLESEKTLWISGNQAFGHIISTVSMDATFTSTPSSLYQATPAKINWILF